MPKSYDPDTDIPSLDGKVIAITGGNAGLGAETVKRLATHNPKTIFLCARNPSSAESLISSLKTANPSTDIVPITLDLNSLASVKAAAKAITAQATRLDILYNNAGIAVTPPSLTEDGYETQFGINHVGHALLTQLLLPLMLETVATSPPNTVRIINISSMAHSNPTGLFLSEAKTTKENHHSLKRYGQSKLANVLFAKKLAQLYPSITSVSVHPGFVDTEINRAKGGGSFWFGLLARNIVGWVGISVEDGTKTQLWCGTAEGVKSGAYYVPTGVESAGSKLAQSDALRDELWEWTDEELKANGGPGWPAQK